MIQQQQDKRPREEATMTRSEWLRTSGRRLQEEYDRDITHLAEDAETRIALIERELADGASARERDQRAANAAVEAAKAEYDAAVAHCATIREQHHAAAQASARAVRDVRQQQEYRAGVRLQELRKALDSGWFDHKQSAAAQAPETLQVREHSSGRDELGALAEAGE
jgi:hypothetical protein